MLWSQVKLRYCQHDRVTSPLEKYTQSLKSSDNFIANDRIIKCFGVFFWFFKTSTAVHETNIQNKLSAIQVWFSLVCAFAASSGVTSPPRGEATTTFFQAQQFDGGKPRRARRSTSTASNIEENMAVSSKVRCVDCDTGDTAPVLLLSLCFIQMNLLESLLLMSTSSSRSLALTCLYSLYSTASGERSSFCTFLQEQGGKRYDTARKKPSCRGFLLCTSKYLTLTNSFFLTFRFV